MQNGCAMSPNSTTMGPVQTDDFPSCRAGRQVRLLSIEGLDHSYPVGPRFDATDTILAFLLAQQRP
jgi:poly(3-hydroxybutyrate) depolymerase